MPTLPEPLEPLANCPLPPLAEGESEGLGAYELPFEPPPEEAAPDFEPAGADVPPTGPVERVLPTGAPLGAGTVKLDDGFGVGAGADIGLDDGLAVGGAGFAGDGLF